MKANTHLKILFVLILCFSSFAYAEADLYNQTILGEKMPSKGKTISSTALSTDIEELQTFNAEGETQLLTKEAVYEFERQELLRQADDGWSIIVAVFVLLGETVKLLMYLVEMRLLLYLFVDLFPEVFVKIRDNLTNWYIARRR